MKILANSVLALLLTVLSSTLVLADEYDDTITSFKNAGASATYFDKSAGYAVFPTIGKAGLGIGAAHGSGRVYKGGEVIGTASMTQVTLGLQMGAEAYSQIVFFETENALNTFIAGDFQFSADASAVAITAGVTAGASTGSGAAAGASGTSNTAVNTSAGYFSGMAVFTVAKGGLMYQATLGGQVYSFDPIKE